MSVPVRSYDAAALHSLLPHRFPFLLVDRIDVVEPGVHVVGFRRLTNSDWWIGEKGSRAMPFGLVLEALAQASGGLIPDLVDGASATVAYFMGADRVRQRRPAVTGDALTLDVRLLRWRRGLCRAKGTATVDGALVLSAELTTVVRGVSEP
jgi:3-hydroxyacyl-[acyl-carrier-protein] dehydratase